VVRVEKPEAGNTPASPGGSIFFFYSAWTRGVSYTSIEGYV